MNELGDGGVIRFEVETQHKAWGMFDLATENMDKILADAMAAGHSLVDATIACRQFMMSFALGVAANIRGPLRQAFEETEQWWEFVDDQIAQRDHAVATMPEETE